MCEGRLWKRASLFIGAQLGNLEWAHLPGTLRDGRKFWKENVSLSLWELCEGNLEGGNPLLGTRKVTYWEVLQTGITLHWDPAGDP
jgi:hypothetical protein